ncbi:nitrate- and nitrite sensing domain-containing protein [Streptomyces sp. SCA3-4]|uniref:sensor histidine kinase n=1 Tax=Streptomyces sichuanensis TaxID=2871810 RepID=UPI001CE2FE22|nr:nitrate- and nitrite sensing domain-containing protein [Streptomyces sichuanensis]MCA6093799.1 nitrate- and nitrite sensing domain-containing protein [Streptomyces sichuanensis]
MRLRTLLVWLAVVPTVAMGVQVLISSDRSVQESRHLRKDVAAGRQTGVPLYQLMTTLQSERAVTAAWWSGMPVSGAGLRDRRAATDRAVAVFLKSSDADQLHSDRAKDRLRDVAGRLADLGAQRERTDARHGSADDTVDYYTDVISGTIRCYGDFNHVDDGGLTQETASLAALFSAAEVVAREDSILALAGPSGRLTSARFGEFVKAVGASDYLYDTVALELPLDDQDTLQRILTSNAWQIKSRIERAVLSEHRDVSSGVVLPPAVSDWRAAYRTSSAQLNTLNEDELQELLAHADERAAQLESQVVLLVAASGAALLLVVAVVVFTTRSVLRRLRSLHDRTVAVAEQTLPDVVDRLQRGEPVGTDALPRPRGEQDEVGRISDAFAHVVAVSVEGHRTLADERHGFSVFASGIAARTGNLVSRQLALTEHIQDTFGQDEALLAELMRSDQLTVGMRRQIENLLILAGGEITDPHMEPMRIADLLREAAAEVEDFRRIDRHAMDETSVEAGVISQLSHLLAELLDNATRFSPPTARVAIRSELVGDGLCIEIEDRGPRVTAERYEEMNGRLHSAPPYSVLASNAHRLGLFVVGHLADQLGATVTLRRSAFGGTSAVVIVPGEHLVPTREGAAVPEPAKEPAPVPRPAQPAEERRPKLVAQKRSGDAADDPAPSASGLPRRERKEQARRAGDTAPEAPAPARSGSGDAPGRPALPERVPQTHMTQRLREPRAAEPVGQDAATPEEVADAWADYEDSTRQVELELRQDQS